MGLSVSPQRARFGMHDSYSIGRNNGLSIPIASALYRAGNKLSNVPWRDQSWTSWGQRIRIHMRERRLRPMKVADKLKISEPALRSWINGHREINLSDFFRLCLVIEADPHLMLFGKPSLSAEQRAKIGQFMASILEADTSLNPSYHSLIGKLQKDLNGKRGK